MIGSSGRQSKAFERSVSRVEHSASPFKDFLNFFIISSRQAFALKPFCKLFTY